VGRCGAERAGRGVPRGGRRAAGARDGAGRGAVTASSGVGCLSRSTVRVVSLP